jgi:hypothetical protein
MAIAATADVGPRMNVVCPAFAVRSMRAAGWAACIALAGCSGMPVQPVAAERAGSAPRESADIEAPFVTTADAALEAAVLAAHPSYTRKLIAAAGASGPARYVHGRADLNGDGRAEVMVFVMGPDFCGAAGCMLMLFSQETGRYTLVKEFPGSRPPLIASPMRTRGWNDLLRIDSGGGAAPAYVRHAFDGKTYIEAERVPVGETPPAGRRLLAGELGDKVGAPLIPRE